MEALERKQAQFSRESAVKVLKDASKEAFKVGKQAQSDYNKGKVTDTDEFLKTFIDSRKQHFIMESYIEIM